MQVYRKLNKYHSALISDRTCSHVYTSKLKPLGGESITQALVFVHCLFLINQCNIQYRFEKLAMSTVLISKFFQMLEEKIPKY